MAFICVKLGLVENPIPLVHSYNKPKLLLSTHSSTRDPLLETWNQRFKSVTLMGYDHYNDVIMGAIASKITSLTIVYSTVYWDAYQRKHQSSASLAFVRWIHRIPRKNGQLRGKCFHLMTSSWQWCCWCQVARRFKCSLRQCFEWDAIVHLYT